MKGRFISAGVVGVALRDLAIGKGGKAQSWGSEISGDGGREGSGEVALLGSARRIDFRPFPYGIGDALRGLLVLLRGEN